MQKQSVWQQIQNDAHGLADFQDRILLTLI
jgi:hypothetical protein